VIAWLLLIADVVLCNSLMSLWQAIRQEYDSLQQSFEAAQRQFAEMQRQTKALEAEIADITRDKQEALHDGADKERRIQELTWKLEQETRVSKVTQQEDIDDLERRIVEKERRIRDLEWKIEDVRKECEVELKAKDQQLEAKDREVKVSNPLVSEIRSWLVQESDVMVCRD